jgi:hypothetical protein
LQWDYLLGTSFIEPENARVRVRPKDEQQQTTVIRTAANYAARAMNCHLTNTRAMSVASVRIVATARRRHLYMCICRGLGCGLWK